MFKKIMLFSFIYTIIISQLAYATKKNVVIINEMSDNIAIKQLVSNKLIGKIYSNHNRTDLVMGGCMVMHFILLALTIGFMLDFSTDNCKDHNFFKVFSPALCTFFLWFPVIFLHRKDSNYIKKVLPNQESNRLINSEKNVSF